MNDYTKNCENLTKMSEKLQNQKVRFFSKVDITTKLKIIEHQKQLFHKMKSTYSDVDNIVLTFSSLIFAINQFAKNMNIYKKFFKRIINAKRNIKKL